MKAFPVTKFNSHRVGHDGMDLRDYFAAAAMQSLIREMQNRGINGTQVVKTAYQYADEMLKARVAK